MGNPNLSGRHRTYPIMNVTMDVQRRPVYYMWNVVVPLLSFVLMAFTTHFVPCTEVADRLSLSLTLVLTAAAYKFVVSGMLPAIGYSTMLDTYVTGCSFFLFVIVIENGVMGGDGFKEYDRLAFMVVGFAFGLMNAGFTLKGLWLIRAMKKDVKGSLEDNHAYYPDKVADGLV